METIKEMKRDFPGVGAWLKNVYKSYKNDDISALPKDITHLAPDHLAKAASRIESIFV